MHKTFDYRLHTCVASPNDTFPVGGEWWSGEVTSDVETALGDYLDLLRNNLIDVMYENGGYSEEEANRVNTHLVDAGAWYHDRQNFERVLRTMVLPYTKDISEPTGRWLNVDGMFEVPVMHIRANFYQIILTVVDPR